MRRRDFVQQIGALGAAAALPSSAFAKSYDPAAKFDLKVTDVPFRRNAAGRNLFARVYQPDGAGPFPMVLDLHGGAWTRKDRFAEEPMDRALAASARSIGSSAKRSLRVQAPPCRSSTIGNGPAPSGW